MAFNDITSTGMKNLEDNLATLEKLEKSNKALARKLEHTDWLKAREKSFQHQLNHELSRIKMDISDTKSGVESLEANQKKLYAVNQELILQIKHVRNYFGYVNALQVDRKAQWMQNIRGELSALDFTLEEIQNDPGQDMETFTQYWR